MDVFERVRDVNAGVSMTEDRISGARSRLLDGIDAGRTAERKRLVRRPMFVIAGAVATVAAVTATVIVINQPVAPARRVEAAVPTATGDPRTPGETTPQPESTAGAVVTEPFPGTTPQAGQYLKITSTAESLYYRDGNGTVSQSFHSFIAPPVAAALVRFSSSTIVPADRSGEWVSSRGPSNEFLRAFGADDSTLGTTWQNLLPYSPEVVEERSIGGLVYGDRTGVGGPTFYDAHPRDPQALWNYWYDFFSQAGSSREESVLYSILDVLKSNFAPADVRATYLAALQNSGLAEIVATDGSVVTYAVQFREVDARTEKISIDTSTGWVTGYTSKDSYADGALVPGDVPNVRVTCTVSIVNSVP